MSNYTSESSEEPGEGVPLCGQKIKYRAMNDFLKEEYNVEAAFRNFLTCDHCKKYLDYVLEEFDTADIQESHYNKCFRIIKNVMTNVVNHARRLAHHPKGNFFNEYKNEIEDEIIFLTYHRNKSVN